MRSTVTVREAQDDDTESIVRLFCEGGLNPYGWSADKWRHYYRDYSEGKAISLVAVVNEQVVGHYGLLPIMISDYPAVLGAHAYINPAQRGLAVISALMQAVDSKCLELGVYLAVGFANQRFSIIKSTIFKWKTVCWLGFQKGLTEADYLEKLSKPFCFQYSEKWSQWRFGSTQREYISRYVDSHGTIRKQLLKATARTNFGNLHDAEGWTPACTYPVQQANQFCQPLSIRIFDQSIIEKGILESRNWGIEMSDSDTFQYTPWE